MSLFDTEDGEPFHVLCVVSMSSNFVSVVTEGGFLSYNYKMFGFNSLFDNVLFTQSYLNYSIYFYTVSYILVYVYNTLVDRV